MIPTYNRLNVNESSVKSYRYVSSNYASNLKFIKSVKFSDNKKIYKVY